MDWILHVDDKLVELVARYGVWTYGILFAIIFAETGFVVTPFLPGDSLLFAAGVLSNKGSLNVVVLCVVLFVAAVLGDTVNYMIGQYFGARLTNNPKSRLIKREHLERTHAFFEKHGGKTIILARFVPIVRTFAPFVAGMGSMRYGQFVLFNVVGALLWVGLCVPAGYLFANQPFVRDRFELVVLAIVGLSVLPMVVEFILHKRNAARHGAAAKEAL
uniref:DedA protein n=1 Tax=uncultured Armatimonadetes bacterium TaxID=157466 RepID=A0A6J4I0G8_9BACT|nr:DedA protein [uncultured Armatimonadetes bacterium]